MIATIDQIVHRIDDRQSGANIGLEQKLDITMTGRIFQSLVILI